MNSHSETKEQEGRYPNDPLTKVQRNLDQVAVTLQDIASITSRLANIEPSSKPIKSYDLTQMNNFLSSQKANGKSIMELLSKNIQYIQDFKTELEALANFEECLRENEIRQKNALQRVEILQQEAQKYIHELDKECLEISDLSIKMQ
eukprot:TRINITY_DN4818_c0_g1_i1.p1 TRINITY_DN4818_c0_g1~~TRINITY_DN4818_c0_g1_i1.p1  ORF type:complete len:147 (+),score=32.05 TRINITY_DN4818_c0_g1_i1:50-490(+)